jgi:ribose 5-phosphate isomerase A
VEDRSRGKQLDPSLEAKRRAGIQAASMVVSDQVVGLGTGSTAARAIEELGRRIREESLRIVGIPTSYQAARLAREQGIPVRSMDDVEGIDIAIDGADEVDPARNLIKGGGGAHTREKVVASAAGLFVVVVDESKIVRVLGEKTAIPVEVISMAVAPAARKLRDLGGAAELRMGLRKDGPVITDEGNLILDVRFGPVTDPAGLERAINAIPGVLDNGLFVGLAGIVLVGVAGASEVRRIS